MGHNLLSGLTSAVALAACRNARRTGADLRALVENVDEALSRWLPDQFCTGVLARLDYRTGVLEWSNCGHPAPLLIRDQQLIVDRWRARPTRPWGCARCSPRGTAGCTRCDCSPATGCCCTPTV
nr:PP2C family protein-serine/threonine phosphatase [Streptomyces sp. SID161]